MIIKKCPAYYENLGCMSEKTNFTDCNKKDDCVIKQLIKNFPEISELLGVEYDN